MNKKGGMLTMVLILIALTIGTAITAGNISPEQVDVVKESFANNISDINVSLPEYPELQNAINYYATGFLRATLELVKWTMSYAANNPNVPYKLLLYGLILAIAAPLLIALIKLIAIIFLFTKEAILSSKERKKLRNYKGGNIQ